MPNIPADEASITSAQLESLNAKNSATYLYGEIVYTDEFERICTIQFRMVHTVEDTAGMAFAEAGNALSCNRK